MRLGSPSAVDYREISAIARHTVPDDSALTRINICLGQQSRTLTALCSPRATPRETCPPQSVWTSRSFASRIDGLLARPGWRSA